LADLKIEHGILVGEPDTALTLEGSFADNIRFAGVDLSIAGRRA